MSNEPDKPTQLDVGYGTGILALAGIKLGASTVLAVDSDPIAVQSARNNAALNGVEEALLLRQRSLDELDQKPHCNGESRPNHFG